MTSMTAKPILEIRDLKKRFAADLVLNGINLKVNQGEVISLIGSSGSGKSTLLRCINFLEMPTSGAVSLHGQTVQFDTDRQGISSSSNTAAIPEFRKQIGMVFQSFNLWPHRRVIQNVTEALRFVKGMKRAEAEETAIQMLAKVGMAEKRDAYPSQLSGGQQQRVAIARALAMKPGVVLFDEPTSALDPELVGEVLKVIRKLAEEGNTILLVMHEMRFAREVSSRIIFLHQGRIEEDDTPEVIFTSAKSERVRSFLSQH
ncbi:MULTISPECIES: amino acid ABC transporter ATP-binding protein [unclassified Caballeronia]|uniref:amino acid ABC transporter ATP-binding protein n=1 Tax=unclassified Caballeronia TaxID=2646786 RepID=UPI00285A04D0|nr:MULTISPECIES: amino acid ABC transporter ATP-binding protein [unclassified Caballeronia]MDR5777468.1 amino acid ABC transporter ATP-binding protein [Caballeronia sp. LZ002]MDR5852931.1 amino acid ABC transporter ATP-binding protein [Caballeronia sp. LZ003]